MGAKNPGCYRQHEDKIITDLFQPLGDDLSQHSHDDPQSYPRGFETYSFEHLDLFYEEYFQPPLCSNFDEGKDMIGLEKGFSDESFQPIPFSPCYSIIDAVGSFPSGSHFPIRNICFNLVVHCRTFQSHTQGQQTLGWYNFFFSRSSFIPYLALSLPIDNLIVFLRFPLIPSRSSSGGFVAEDGDMPLFDYFNLVLGWIGKGCGDTSLHDFVLPSRFHELDFMTSYGKVYVPTHEIFVLDLSLFWFMMKHMGIHFDTMLRWFY
jgi:hypothetical protein